ncbi:polysaccharide deacetylase family protein [Salirhabdus euzebyi]|nr:polysaccharide deacetylase family protein [Salirhabdus euzebyi]
MVRKHDEIIIKAFFIFFCLATLLFIFNIILVSKTKAMITEDSVFNEVELQKEYFQLDQEIRELKKINYEAKQSVKKKLDKEIPVENKVNNKSYKQKTVYITFDDGPSNNTDELLEVLKSYQAKATFFMLEPNMRKYPDATKAIIRDGHVPGLHGVSHNKQKFYESKNSVISEMKQTQVTLKSITGISSNLIRTPYGSSPHLTSSQLDECVLNGFIVWDWTIDSEDWKYKKGEYVQKVIHELKSFSSIEKPVVILLHDKKTTIDYLPNLLSYLDKEDYELDAMNEQMNPYHF